MTMESRVGSADAEVKKNLWSGMVVYAEEKGEGAS
jgi:hypothetical protein